MLGKYCFIHQSVVARSGEYGKCFEAESDGNEEGEK